MTDVLTENPLDILRDLFRLYRPNIQGEMDNFIRLLEMFELPFNLFEQLRRLQYPGYPKFEWGLMDVFYYFVPNSGFGSHLAVGSDPLGSNAVYQVDGFGLNLGCPLRLQGALSMLEMLDGIAGIEPVQGIKVRSKHLATVEELLFLEMWKKPLGVSRPTAGIGKSFDWVLRYDDVLINIECKFRPVDWVRLSDGTATERMKGFLLGKAKKQLPIVKKTREINVVGIIGMGPLNEEILGFLCEEMADADSVDVVIYKTLSNSVWIVARNHYEMMSIRAYLVDRLPAIPYQVMYRILNDRAAKERRIELRSGLNVRRFGEGVDLYISEVERESAREIVFPTKPYRFKIVRRGSDHEPHFKAIPPFLWSREKS